MFFGGEEYTIVGKGNVRYPINEKCYFFLICLIYWEEFNLFLTIQIMWHHLYQSQMYIVGKDQKYYYSLVWKIMNCCKILFFDTGTWERPSLFDYSRLIWELGEGIL